MAFVLKDSGHGAGVFPTRCEGITTTGSPNMTTTNRYTARYASAPRRPCSTPSCNREAAPGSISSRCHRCGNNVCRYAHPLQSMPMEAEFSTYIRRAQEARGSLKALDLAALKAHWDDLAATARGEATATYTGQRRLTYNKTHREACGIIRDLSEALSFTRILDLATACHLHQRDRPHAYMSEDSFRCVMVEQMRRAGHIGRHIVEMREDHGTIRRSYRNSILKATRLEVARLILTGVGQAAAALAKLAHTKAEREKATQRAYYNTVSAIAGSHP
jgi:hypothetical protein